MMAAILPSAMSGAPEITRMASGSCVRVKMALPSGAFPTVQDLEPAACGSGAIKATTFDPRLSLVRATRDLKPGDVIQAPPAFAVAGIAPDQALVMEARVGPVTVQRLVKAVQPSRPGRRVFVRTEDGTVLSIPYPREVP